MGELMTKYMWKERQHEITEDAKKFVTQIIARYQAAYSYCILQQLRNDLDGRNEPSLLLEQRKWQSYNRPLQSGAVYVLCGSDNRKWRRRYCVLQPDYTLEVYDSEEDFEIANRPRYAHKHSSFDVIDNVDSHISQLVKEYMRDFGYVRENVAHVVKKVCAAVDLAERPTQHVLGLHHKYRGCFYLATDSAVEKDKWLKSLQDAQRQLAGVHGENLAQRKAFELAIRQTCEADEQCNVTVKLAGTQEEITEDFIANYLSDGCKTMLQTQVKGNVYKKYRMWASLLKMLFGYVERTVKENYPILRAKAEAEVEKYRQKMLTSMPQINAVYETACAEIIAGLEACFHEELEVRILPKIPDMVTKMGASMATPLREVRNIFVTLAESVRHMVTSKSTGFANNIDRYFLTCLDATARNPEDMQIVFQGAIGNKSPFGILSGTFSKAEYSELEAKLCVLLQKLLDSAVYTFEFLCGEVVMKNDGHLQAVAITNIERRALKKLNHDNVLLTKQFLTETTVELAFQMLHSFIYHDSRNKMRNYEDFIPSEFKAFLPVPSVFHDAVRNKLAEDLKPMLSAAFKRLEQDHFNVVHDQFSSTSNSYSSDEVHTSTKHESSALEACSSHVSPSQDFVSANTDTMQSQDDRRSPLHWNNDDGDDDDNTENESDASEETESRGSPCPHGYVKDGETGECTGAVDEISEDVPSEEDWEENSMRNEDELVAQVNVEDSSEDCDVSDDFDDSREVAVELQDDSDTRNEVENRKLRTVASGAESIALDEDRKRHFVDAGKVEESGEAHHAEAAPVEVTADGAAGEFKEAMIVILNNVECGLPAEIDSRFEQLAENGFRVDENVEVNSVMQNLASEDLSVEIGGEEELNGECPNDAAGEKTESQLAEETSDEELEVAQNGAAKLLDAESITSEDKESQDSNSENEEDGSSPAHGVQEQDSSIHDETMAKNTHPIIKTSFLLQQDPCDIKNGQKFQQPNGSISQNGLSGPAQDAGDNGTPPVPARRKKRTPPKVADSQVLILSRGDDMINMQPQQCIGNTDLEKYNGITEQIIQTGEEKLI